MQSTSSEPRRFGKYQILGRVAVGGMAEIYKARLDGEGGFQRTFALKRILPHLTSRPEFVDMLVEEAKIAGLLSHANIVQIMDLGEVGGTYYIAMEYVDGPDLGRILRQCQDKGITLPVPHAVFIVIEVLKALEYAHNRRVMRGGKEMPLSIVHRDVSPANVLVSFQGEVKLTDFGIAKASVKALETVSGIIKGRFDYLSPEQAAGRKPDHRADLFAAGVLLYECLAGRHPFKQRSEAATIDAIRAGSYPPASEVNPDVPYALELVLERALAVDPADRHASATEMKAALERFFHDSGFIFSHSTLAAFLKGLFPKEAGQSAGQSARPSAGPAGGLAAPGPLLTSEGPPPTDEQETRLVGRQDAPARPAAPAPAAPAPAAPAPAAPAPAAPALAGPRPAAPALAAPARNAGPPPDVLGRRGPAPRPGRVPSPDDPFGIADSTARKTRPAGLAAAPDMPDLPGAPPMAGFGDESTLIRPPPGRASISPVPLHAPAPLQASAALQASDWGDLETVIKPMPAGMASGAGAPGAAAPGAAFGQDTTVLRPAPEHDTVVRPAPRVAPASTAGRGVGFGVHVLYLSLVVLCSAASLFTGVLLAQWRLGADADVAGAVVLQHPPQLRVVLPEGAALSVDGRPVPGPSPIDVPLTAGEPHQVEITLAGHNPWTTQIRLEPNELRVLTFAPASLDPGRR